MNNTIGIVIGSIGLVILIILIILNWLDWYDKEKEKNNTEVIENEL